ncbi:tRNA dihydrouridine synthase [Sulfurospirillum arcachonense]|uniref:tRNA dihydrouridine synthase n=1 Tax=Sulfurospirillum arcachonense TaxID=57666 RepID=UPI000469CF90|nr:tRNA-dihydrouridine synthase [Sulfurospirillum arcachonense]
MKLIDFDQGIVALAPLAGYTDLPFRNVVKKFGADLTFSEMISANALQHNSKKTFKMLEKSPLETPYIVQLAGSDLSVIREAVEMLNDIEGIDGIDLNCGCPVPKVVSQSSGSSLLLDLPHLVNILETIKKYSNKQYTSAKVRLGFVEKIPEQIGKAVESSGVDFMSVHGRTRAGAYKAPVDYDAIARVKQSVKIPVLANGDITSFEKAMEVKEITGCNSLMIGRGAIGNPWIFYQLKHAKESVDSEIKATIILEHYDSMVEFYGSQGVSMFRKHLHVYSKGVAEASSFRNKINTIVDSNQMRDEIENFFNIRH